MRIRDWSSDVCSSDLPSLAHPLTRTRVQACCPHVLPLARIRPSGASRWTLGQRPEFAAVPSPPARIASTHRLGGSPGRIAWAVDGRVIAVASGSTVAFPLPGENPAAGRDGGAALVAPARLRLGSRRSEEHTSELQSLMRTS